MKIADLSLVITGVLLNAGAQLLLKAGTNAIGRIRIDHLSAIAPTLLSVGTQPQILLGLLCYIFSVGIWIIALSRVEVSVAYPMLSMGYVVNAVLAWRLFDESLTGHRILGIVVILIGVLLVARS